MASGTPKTRKAFEATGEILGNVLEDMQSNPQNTVRIPTQAENTLIQELQQIENNIRGRTHALSPKEELYADFVKSMLDDIRNNGSTPGKLVGSWRSVNKIGAGKTELSRIKDPILKAIESANPKLAKDLQSTNKLYARYIGNLKEINPQQFNSFIDAGELQQFLGAVFTLQPMTLGQQVLNIGALGALRRIHSNILINPVAQSLVRNFGKAIRDGNGASARSVAIQLKDYVQKTMPEEYKEVDWEKLDIE